MQTLYENDASIHILYHKVEALVDGYLDTSTPPWIKVISNENCSSSVFTPIKKWWWGSTGGKRCKQRMTTHMPNNAQSIS